MLSKIEINCGICGILFLRSKREFNRSEKLGRRSFCSRKCAGKAVYGNFGDKINRNTSHLNPANRRDSYSGYRVYLRCVRQRNHEYDLDLKFLKALFEEQQGVCFYSKVLLKHPKGRKGNNPIYTASLDRIDSSKGYIKGNVQFISVAMNLMKSSMSHEQTVDLLNILKKLK